MEGKRIEEIVRKVHEKAKDNCASHSNHALSTHVADNTQLSYKTIERAIDRYINGQSDIGEPSEATVNMLCVFLGYENYEAFVDKNRGVDKGKEVRKKRGISKYVILISIVFAAILGTAIIYVSSSENKSLSLTGECMVWSETHYKKVACNKKYGEVVEPIDPVKLANFKKIEVTLLTTFFDENTNKPLVWYNKTKEGTIEYFTAPGLHPITGKTLNPITPYIIEKYVPKHKFEPDSFIENE